ncbi:hemagglutinin repeat-containing protein [Rosenbergiella collisarenosi]|uniref:hemagglutinin repeat-containing protein n=1 Tax=Rosenbergiella collisarenosi TaxID=1544695 RepID=UPI001F50208E|nr:hemagglutinin repeat-containing protein [Rosenbergiella collisarenosi]
MNKNRYRIVFNRARGMAMVVADITVATQSLSAPCPRIARQSASGAFRLTRLSLALLLAAGSISLPAQARIIADSQAAQRPTVVQTASGMEQVNIRPPSAAGVSHNTYTQFDIERQGAILNNGRTASQTQLAGHVTANPWLAKGEAKVILNEVNSRDPSRLNGLLEVAGRQADIIIANPAGITCDGCGFINANRATLTTGNVALTDGQLSHYAVERGLIRVEGKGMDSTRQDSTELLARAVKINAAVHAKALAITVGANKIDARNGAVHAQSARDGERPEFAVDVSQLGGMYANKIVLRGTEAGVGVRNAGTLGAAAGEVVITTAGTLTHSGNLQASQHIQLTAGGDLTSSGVLAAGIAPQGQAGQSANLTLTSAGAIALSGVQRAQGKVRVSAQRVTANTSQIQAESVELNASAGNVETRNARVVAKRITVSSTADVINDGGHLSGETLAIRANRLSNRGGTLAQQGEQALTLAHQGGIDNTQGRILTQGQRLSLSGSQLLNQQGEIRGTEIDINTPSSLLDNRLGVIAASRRIGLTSQGLNNDSGLIQAGESLMLALQGGRLTNRGNAASGGILSEGRLTLSSGDLDNQQGIIAAREEATLSTAVLTNQGGTILGGADLRITTRGLHTSEGLIQADHSLDITTQHAILDNTRGELLAGQGLSLDSGELVNHAGRIAANGDISVKTAEQRLDNRAGRIAAGRNLQLLADTLINFHGEIQALGDLQAQVAGQLTNDQGWLRSGQAMTLLATSVSNRGEQPDQQGIEGQSITLSGQTIDNTGGAIRSQQALVLNIAKHLNNRGGILSSQQQLVLQGRPDTSVDNEAGTFIAGDHLQISAGTLSGLGDLLSANAMTLAFNQHFLHGGRISANGNLSASFHQGLTNQGQLNAGGVMTVQLPFLTNLASGELSGGQTQLWVDGRLENKGLIDGGLTHLRAAQLDNLAGGRLYADQLVIETQRLTQRQHAGLAPIIAARQQLLIATHSLYNLAQSILFSAGELVVGGRLTAAGQVQGEAIELTNTSATIEALGAITLSSQSVNNLNETLTTALVETENAAHHEVALSGSAQRYDWQEVDTHYKNKYGVHLAKLPDGTQDDDFYEYQFQRSVVETQLVTSDPAKIIAGADLTLQSEQVTNQDSLVMAGGRLLGVIGTLNNRVTWGQQTITDSGTVTHWYAKKKDRPIGGTITSQGKRHSAYVPSPIVKTVDLQQSRWQEHAHITGGGTVVTDRETQALTPTASGVRPLDSDARLPSTVTQALDQRASVTDTPIGFIPVTLTLPHSALYQLRPSSEVAFLIETDPRFTQHQQFLSSDRVFDQLAWTDGRLAKRLGDGFYEQVLVREQITALTGSRFLNGFNNDEQQYRALLDAGIAFAQRLNLTPGIALSAEQVAQLTQDMVWLVQQAVTLPDGSSQRVWVPQVYARVQAGDVTRQGGLLSAQQTQLQLTGNLVNSGSLMGRELTQITAENITNRGDISGRDVDLTARSNISNLGGRLQAEQSLSAFAAGDIISQTLMAGDDDNRWRDRSASIFVQGDGGRLTLQAHHDLKLVGSQVNNQGQGGHTALSAGNDVYLSTVTTASHESTQWDKGNNRRVTQMTELGSQVEGNGQITLLAGREINLQAAKVLAGEALTLRAGRDLTLSSGQSQQTVTENSQQRSAGWLSSKMQTRHESISTTQALGSAVEGESVHLQAGNDLTLAGSRAIGTQAVTLQAGNQVQLTQAQNSRQEVHRYEEKRKGLSGTGGIGFSYGQHAQRTTDEGASVSHLASLVGSSEGSVKVTAGNGITLTGAELLAKRDIDLAAKQVTITTSESRSTQSHLSEQKSSGLTLALSGVVGGLVNQAITQATSASEESSGRLAALKGVQAALSGVQAYQAQQGAGLAAESPGSMVGINLSWGTQSSTSTQTQTTQQQQGSQLTAGNNLTITADGGDVRLVGSHLQAGQDLTLTAQRDVLIESAQNSQHLTGKNSSQGGSFGIGINFGSGSNGISVNASLNTAKGRENGTAISHSETLLDAGNTLNIVSGRDTQLQGAQASGHKVSMTVGRNLTLTSEQDSDDYTATQTSASAGGSASMGGGSISLNASRDNLDSTYASVQEQTGIFAGQGGFSITVGQHTQLNGAVIGSTAAAQNNQLQTGTLGFTDIDNHAEYKVEHKSVGMSSGGDPTSQLLKSAANSLLLGAAGAGSADSVTHSAISQGTLVVRDVAEQSQSLSSLSRDVENAHQALSPIFDKEKEQNRLREAQLISSIGAQAANIAQTQGQLAAIKTATEKVAQLTPEQQETIKAQWLSQHPGQQPDERTLVEFITQQFYQQAMNDSGFGVGGSVQRAIQAVSAAVQGLAGGEFGGALAGAGAPYIANIIGQSELDTNGKLLAHATVNAVLAAAQGNNALVGATAATSAELVGVIAAGAYGRDVNALTENEKQMVSIFATLAAGLAGGLVGGDMANAMAGAHTGKVTVENNLLGGSEEAQAAWIRQHGIDMASCADNSGGSACQKAKNERDAVGFALATGSVALLPGGAQAMWGLGAGANAGISYWVDGAIDPANAAISGWVNVLSMGNGVVGTVGWNAAGGALGNWIDNKDPLSGALINGAGSSIGYGIGKGLSWGINTGANWWKGGWDPKFNPTLQNYTEIKGDFGISKEVTPSNIPGSFGDIGASFFSEYGGKKLEPVIEGKLK